MEGSDKNSCKNSNNKPDEIVPCQIENSNNSFNTTSQNTIKNENTNKSEENRESQEFLIFLKKCFFNSKEIRK